MIFFSSKEIDAEEEPRARKSYTCSSCGEVGHSARSRQCPRRITDAPRELRPRLNPRAERDDEEEAGPTFNGAESDEDERYADDMEMDPFRAGASSDDEAEPEDLGLDALRLDGSDDEFDYEEAREEATQFYDSPPFADIEAGTKRVW